MLKIVNLLSIDQCGLIFDARQITSSEWIMRHLIFCKTNDCIHSRMVKIISFVDKDQIMIEMH
jgi:hypothetical protein